MVPAVLKCGGSGFGVFPVALRYIRPMYEQFAIFSDAHINAWKRVANALIGVVVVARGGDDRGTFGRAVALHHAKAHIFPSLSQFRP